MPRNSQRMNEHSLIYDWNTVGDPPPRPVRPIEFDDETLRDGLQSPSVTQPSLEQRKEMLHLMVALGIHAADIGLPGAGPRMAEDTKALAKEIADHNLPIAPNCAARTLATDIQPIVDASQHAGIPVEASLFIGSSPIREYVENWSIERMLSLTKDAVTFATKHGLSVMFVTEDTTRSQPEDLRKLYAAAIECGARRLCVCDTVGHATPHGVRSLIHFVKGIAEDSGESVKVDWHGHRDRGLALENTIAAIEAGADRVHGCALGIGERCGNTAMEHLLVNLKLLGWIDNDLSRLYEYCELASLACGVPIPFNHPVIGSDAFRTSTGVHAAAVIKAMKKGHDWLANRVYSGVPANWTGRTQTIEIGPMSGASNVEFWLESHGIEPEEHLVQTIFNAAKQHSRVLKDEEILNYVQQSASRRP
jgi:2-isopropylmalate synthase